MKAGFEELFYDGRAECAGGLRGLWLVFVSVVRGSSPALVPMQL